MFLWDVEVILRVLSLRFLRYRLDWPRCAQLRLNHGNLAWWVYEKELKWMLRIVPEWELGWHPLAQVYDYEYEQRSLTPSALA